MTAPNISAIYIALGGLLLLAITVRVILGRRDNKVALGDGGNAQMERLMRMHANAIETLPIQLLLLLALELLATSPALLHAAGAAIIVSRALHAYGMASSGGLSAGRMIGTVISIGLLITLPALLLCRALG